MAAVRIAVIGAGALGCLLGAYLPKKAGVTLVGRRAAVEAINGAGISVEGLTSGTFRPGCVEDPTSLPSQDIVMFAVKSYDTREAARTAACLVAGSTSVLTLQNGLGNLEALEEAFARSGGRILGGTISHGITLLAPGRIRHAGTGAVRIGEWRAGGGPTAEEVAALFTECGLHAAASADIRRDIWLKAVVNAGINPLTALTRLPNGGLLESPDLTALLEAVCLESAAVARASGVEIADEEAVRVALDVARNTAANRSSMLQDIERGRRTEVASINGAFVEHGRRHGVPTPLNGALLALVKAVEGRVEG